MTSSAYPNRTCSTTLVDLGAVDLRLLHPLVIMLDCYSDEAVASWPEVDAWASATTEGGAVNALKDEIVSLYRELSSTPDSGLGKLPLRWKRALMAVIASVREKS